MRIIASITHSSDDIRHILTTSGRFRATPHLPSAGHLNGMTVVMRRWMTGRKTEPADWDLAAQPAPDFEVDQRISW